MRSNVCLRLEYFFLITMGQHGSIMKDEKAILLMSMESWMSMHNIMIKSDLSLTLFSFNQSHVSPVPFHSVSPGPYPG
jgi:hypothetical protein